MGNYLFAQQDQGCLRSCRIIIDKRRRKIAIGTTPVPKGGAHLPLIVSSSSALGFSGTLGKGRNPVSGTEGIAIKPPFFLYN